MSVSIDGRCTACGVCLATCPSGALRAAPGRPDVDRTRCDDCLACVEVCPVDAVRTDPSTVPAEAVHPIETQSYAIMSGRIDLSDRPPGAHAVVARMVHATADESFAETARIGSDAVMSAVDALRRRAVVVCDARMVVAGIPSVSTAVCHLDDVPTAPPGDTRSAAAVRLAAERYPAGALWVVGNAPTALFAILDLHRRGLVDPAAVVGVPVGYVGAAESKAALWDSPLQSRAITNVGRRGGSPVAAAAVNALHRLASGSTIAAWT